MEKLVLAVYKYYTENGKNKCCSLNSHQIAEELNISSRYIKTIKKHLKELGYIRTDGGIKVIYVGLTPTNKSEQGTTAHPEGGEPQLTPTGNYSSLGGEPQLTPGGNYSSPQQGTTVHPKGEPQLTHKKEKKEKEELKEEIKEEEKIAFANLKLIVDKLYPTYKTPDKVKFLWDKFKDRLSNIDLSESGAVDNWVVGFQNTLLKEYPTEQVKQVTPQPKTKSDTIDMF